jgi:hypothetical protein
MIEEGELAEASELAALFEGAPRARGNGRLTIADLA